MRAPRAWATTLLAVLICGACTVAPPVAPSPIASSEAPAGGVLRLVVPRADVPVTRFTDPEGDPAALDPHLDPFSAYDSWELMRCCLTRALLSTNGRSAEGGGSRLHPDLAAEMPEISADGLTWTFRLRRGLHFGPPFEEIEIAAADVVRGFRRALSPTFDDNFIGPLFDDIVGAEAYASGAATSIAGIATPDSHTLILRLTKPAGDLAARLAMPLIVPIPADPADPSAPFGVATGHEDGYGRFLVSSGPYMLEGSENLDFSMPAAERNPVAGLVPGSSISLVRNPSWNRATDALRPAHPDRIEFYMVDDVAAAAEEIHSRRAHLMLNWAFEHSIPDELAAAVRADPARGRLYVNENDFIASMVINIAQPPFDDIYVRRAVSYAIDKGEIVELLGGRLTVLPAHHLVPNAVVDNLLVDYRPYPSPGDAGDIEAARREMAKSRYDTDGDGFCDAPECSNVRAIAREAPFPPVAESVLESVAELGIELRLEKHDPDSFYSTYADPSEHVGMMLPVGWVKDSLSPASFFVGQFYGPVALGEVGNGSLVGASPEQLQEWGYGDVTVPNVDARIEACLPLTGAAQAECWAALDQHLMRNVVPSVPYGSGVGVVLASTEVENYEWDQLAGAPAFDQIVVSR